MTTRFIHIRNEREIFLRYVYAVNESVLFFFLFFLLPTFGPTAHTGIDASSPEAKAAFRHVGDPEPLTMHNWLLLKIVPLRGID